MRLIIERYLYREIAASFFAVSLLLMVMFFSTTLFRLLTGALEGQYSVGILFSLFFMKVLGNFVFILPFAFFLSVLIAFGRMYKDNEIVVLVACGVGPRRFFIAIGFLALVMAVFVGYLSLYFYPWVSERIEQMLAVEKVKQETSMIIPGRFNTFSKGKLTVYAESLDRDSGILNNVFVKAGERSEQILVNAAKAYERTEANGVRYLIFQDGYRYEGMVGKLDYTVIQFAEHGIRIHEQEVNTSTRKSKGMSTSSLWGSENTRDIAELHWRIAVPVSTLLLALLAIPLSKATPRSGRYAGLFLGVVIYVVYYNLLIVGRSALKQGDVNQYVGLWWVHATVLVFVALMVWRQNRVRIPKSVRTGGT